MPSNGARDSRTMSEHDESGDAGPIWQRAVEARLANDIPTLVSIALDVECPPDILARLSRGGDEKLLAAVLLNPRAPLEALAEGLRSGKLSHQLIVALNPGCAPLSDALLRLGKVCVWAAMFLNSEIPDSATSEIATKHAKLGQAKQVFEAIDGKDWRETVAILDPAGQMWPKPRMTSDKHLLKDPAVPVEILARELRADPPALTIALASNPTARAKIDEVLTHLDSKKLDLRVLASVLRAEELSFEHVKKIAGRLTRVSRSKPNRRGYVVASTRTFPEDTGPRWSLLHAVGLHPSLGRQSAEAILKLVAADLHTYCGFLENRSVAPILTESVKAKFLTSRTPADVELAALVKPIPSPAKRLALASFPRHALAAIAGRPGLDAITLAGLRSEKSVEVVARLAAAGYDSESELIGLAASSSPTVLSGVAAAPNLTDAVAERLLANATLSPRHPSPEFLIPLATNRRVSASVLERVLPRIDRFHGRAPNATTLLATHPNLGPKAAGMLVSRLAGARDILYTRGDLPIELRRTWAKQEQDLNAELLFPETHSEEIEARINHWKRAGADRATLPRLLAIPSLTSTQIERIYEIVGLKRDPNALGFALEALISHSATPQSLLDDLAGIAIRERRGHTLRVLARCPKLSPSTLQALFQQTRGRQERFGPSDESLDLSLAAHPAVPEAVWQKLARSADKRVQAAALGNPSIQLSTVFSTLADAEQRASQIGRVVRWVGFGPARVHVAEVMTHVGLETGDLSVPALLEDLVAAADNGLEAGWLAELLACPHLEPEIHRGLADLVVTNPSRDATLHEARQAIAAWSRDPEVLRALFDQSQNAMNVWSFLWNDSLPEDLRLRLDARSGRSPPVQVETPEALGPELLSILTHRSAWSQGRERVWMPQPESPGRDDVLAALLAFDRLWSSGTEDLRWPVVRRLVSRYGSRFIALSWAHIGKVSFTALAAAAALCDPQQ